MSASKAAWARAWQREAPRLRKALAKGPALAWFQNEHDEEPAAALASLDADGWRRLGTELVRTRDGQLVLGREEAIRLDLHDARAPLGVTAARRPAARR